MASLKKTTEVQLEPFNKNFLQEIWKIGFSTDQPEWTKLNAPYFNDYRKFDDAKSFEESSIADFLMSDDCRCVVANGQPVGMVSKSWVDEATRWLEIGIVIYDVAEKLGFLKEGQIRKVRYYQGQYYDSVKYGILREEWTTRA